MKIPVIHQTDLFHHHADPDDHWDLACQYALAYMNEIDLKGILLDYPPSMDNGDPSVQSIAQMNYITGLSVPAGVGLSKRLPGGDTASIDGREDTGLGGVNMILNILQESREPVAIQVVGSCRDVAAAFIKNRELFRTKCRGIYLNAGTSKEQKILEYNVCQDIVSYSILFDVPCPLYWMPCFEEKTNPFSMGVYGTFYKFRQDEILPFLSRKVQKYFIYALGKVMDNRWLSYMAQPENKTMLEYYGGIHRNMWSTGGFLHTVGKTVTTEGEIVPFNHPGIHPVFSFEPIKIKCDKDGYVDWHLTDESTNRYIFRINDLEKYTGAMVKAMKTLLMNLP